MKWLIPLLCFCLAACARGPSAAPPAKNPVTWFSVPAKDLDASAAFYARAFDWQVEPITREGDGTYDYRVLGTAPADASYTPHERGRINGCLVKRATGISTPTLLVEVDDLAAAAKRIVAAGGTITSGEVPMRSLRGRFFLATDPDGNVIEVFHSDG